jgi:hypothetical protein
MLRPVAILVGVSWLGAGQEHLVDLQRVAQVAAVMLDGDVCLRIRTQRSERYSTAQDPRDPWRASDNYDIDHAAFTQTKKTLIRLAQLCPQTCDVNLWMAAPVRPGRVEIVIRNVHEMSQFWHWGDLDQETPPEMKQVLENAEQLTVRRKEGMISVLAPVLDSLGNVVAIAEVVSQRSQDPHENVK